MAKKSKKSGSTGLNPNSWMITFSDLMTLLLTFFVMLLSMSSMDRNLLERMFTIFKGATGPLAFSDQAQIETLGRTVETMRFAMTSQGGLDDEGLKKLIFQYEPDQRNESEHLASDDIEIKKSRRGLRVRFKDRIFFDAGSANLRPEALPFLDRLIEIIRHSRFRISVEGHSDSVAIQSKAFSSNWKLSLARAIEVVRYFTEAAELSANRFRVGGYGPSRPIAPNDTPKNRQKNRRIEVFLYQND